MYKATIESRLSGEIKTSCQFSDPLELISWIDHTFLEVTYDSTPDDFSTIPFTMSAFRDCLDGKILVVYRNEDISTEFYYLTIKKGR